MNGRTFHAIPRLVLLVTLLSGLPVYGQGETRERHTDPSAGTLPVRFETDDQGVRVLVEDELFTHYLKQSGGKPIFYPVIGPGGHEMTRGYPMREVVEHEKEDHLHHRSFWFTHGDVNGISFWHEQGNHGTIEHRGYLEMSEGPAARIVTLNAWVGPEGNVVCEDVRQFAFGAEPDLRWIDAVITVRASQGPVTFGDTKEGSFGLRVAGSMRVERNEGGRIVNSEGQTDGDAWGKPAAWVDYSGPIGGETVGVAILNHPSSFRFPTHWHVRNYGLFAANPFGLHDFYGSDDYDGTHELAAGETMELRYRVLFHLGDAEEAAVAERFADYAAIREAGRP